MLDASVPEWPVKFVSVKPLTIDQEHLGWLTPERFPVLQELYLGSLEVVLIDVHGFACLQSLTLEGMPPDVVRLSRDCNCKVILDSYSCSQGFPQIPHILQSSGLAGLQSLDLQYWSDDMPTQFVSLSPLSALTCLNKLSIDFPLDTTHQVCYVISDLDGLSPSVVEVKTSSRPGWLSLMQDFHTGWHCCSEKTQSRTQPLFPVHMQTEV